MAILILGVVLFLGIHLLPSSVPLRTFLVARLGFNPYRGLFSLVSLVGLALVVYGKAHAPYLHGFAPPPWGRHVAMLLMLLSALCFAALYLPTNLKRITAHPMLWGTAFWGGAHLFANGDVASMILFGSFLVFALLDIYSSNLRGAVPQVRAVPFSRDLLVGIVGVVIYVTLLFLHPYFAGVAVLRI